ncbi:HD-GYP domain-containing protein [Neiella marina]|uniref:HD-GYP domain-containing protein n=1 Tax=Neiella holothuriorum TaxID=2870530 RepID=A0ABS7ECR8_9GAMM|nr:HD-GYP domain-containing protein [Neiella holothuriorum]MBW8190025.1 HD-GYP domain-containing protein [Neiella holothuriorum]
MKTIPISELKLGMYITEIAKCRSNFVLKKPGFVTSQGSIDALVGKGVELLSIDPSKVLPGREPAAAKPAAETPKTRYDQAPVSVELEMEQAKALYSQAKQLQKKAFRDMEQGHKIDVDAFKDMSEGLIDSVFRNPQALTMMTRIREKDQYLLEHSLNVGILLGVFGRYLKLDEGLISELVTGGLLHDIGKIRVPEEVLHKPGKLTSEEFEIMKRHVLHGRDIIQENEVTLPAVTMEVVLQHHEQLSGTGYPHRLMGDQISRHGRMTSVVDIFDALTGERVYKKAMLPTAALSIIRSMAPDKLDQELVNAFIRCINVYPVGTLVKLQSGRLGIVTEVNEKAPTKPMLKLIYNAKHNRHIQVEMLNLAHIDSDKIVSAEKPEAHGLDLKNYI